MVQSIGGSTKRRGRPKTTGKGTLVGVRLQLNDLGQLDAWIATHPKPQPTRPEAVRRILQEGLSTKSPLNAAEERAALTNEIEVREQDLAAIPADHEQSPEAAIHTMDRAVAENDLAELRHKRKRLRQPSSKRASGGAA